MNEVKFSLIREVMAPKRSLGDAGIDFFIPRLDDVLIEAILLKSPYFIKNGGKISNSMILLPAGVNIVIPSGVKSKIPENVALIQFTKSGVGTKKGLDCFNGVIDSSYQGEIHIHLINNSKEDQVIYPNEKITQFVPVVIYSKEIAIEEYSDSWYERPTTRGAGGFGSTGQF